MPFSVTWHTLLEEAEELPEGASLITPLSHKRFRVTDTQEHRVVIELEESGASRPLQRDQFETLYRRIQDSAGGFDLERLPPDAEPYAAVLTLHPRFEVDETAGEIHQTDAATGTQLVDHGEPGDESERTEPDVSVYSDALLLIDALERNEIGTLEEVETHALVNLYTLLSDVQRGANDLRQDVAAVLLTRMHHDRPVHSQYGSVQRTARRSRSLKDDDEVLAVLADAGIDRERVLGVDSDKVDDALEVTELAESDVYEIEEREYVRKAEVDEAAKESRLQGLKDRLATSKSDEATELREEIEDLEARIDELTGFQPGSSFHTRSRSG